MSTYKEKKIWVVTDISLKARDEARKLAKSDKKRIGTWLDDLILNKSKNITNPDNSYSMLQLRNIESSLEYIKTELHHIKALENSLKILLDRMPKRTILDKIFK